MLEHAGFEGVEQLEGEEELDDEWQERHLPTTDELSSGEVKKQRCLSLKQRGRMQGNLRITGRIFRQRGRMQYNLH